MITCPKCGNQSMEAKYCGNCGQSLGNIMKFNDNSVKIQEDNLPEFRRDSNPGQRQQYSQQEYMYSDENNSQQYVYVPHSHKSKLLGIILNVFLVGLGYAYVGKWGEGILVFIVYSLMLFLGVFFIVPWLIGLFIWVYTLFKTCSMIDKYNKGLPY